MMRIHYISICILLILCFEGKAQETIFTMLKSDVKLADSYYDQRNFNDALKLYLNASKKADSAADISLKIARSHYFLKNYKKAVTSYEKFIAAKDSLATEDLYYYAEANAALSDYTKAIGAYQQYLQQEPGDPIVSRKIWRLSNIHYLYEDSAHFAIQQVPVNSSFGDLCPVSYGDGIVFISNRKEVTWINRIDARADAPFYSLYYSKTSIDTTNNTLLYDNPVIFSNELDSKYHAGPVSFYHDQRKMVFTSSGEKSKTLQLYFAEKGEKDWVITGSYPYNSTHFSIFDVTINEDGSVLFFTSDMDGGQGGKDIYRSEISNSGWTKPENLGKSINTPFDESFPYLHQNHTLYFSSNGHAGLGGLDIFKVELDRVQEVQNMGYPLNSNHDDFGIVIDSLATNGYLTSNRRNGGFNDDIYQFDMDIQPYPMDIAGVIKYIEHSWSDSSDLEVLPHTSLYLIDVNKDITVAESLSDSTGNFTINIPYYGKYKMRVKSENIEGIVSFEVPKHRKLMGKYEIVVVKDTFKEED